ncbi:MAG: hypothetical protein KDJ62_11885, partial [Rhodobiaceae bacterium]|nr:hypothetical protein [Rhodobiaceae bacterium]
NLDRQDPEIQAARHGQGCRLTGIPLMNQCRLTGIPTKESMPADRHEGRRTEGRPQARGI